MTCLSTLWWNQNWGSSLCWIPYQVQLTTTLFELNFFGQTDEGIITHTQIIIHNPIMMLGNDAGN